MGFDCTVRYIEGRVTAVTTDEVVAFQRAADELRQWDGYRYVDLLDRLDAVRTRWPTAELWLLVEGDDGYRAVMHVQRGEREELGARGAVVRDFLRRAKEARYRAAPFEQIDREKVLLGRLDAAKRPSDREPIYEALLDVPGAAVDDRLVRAIRDEDARAWVTLAYVLGGRAGTLPRLLRELVSAWPDRAANEIFVERLVSVCERRSRSDLDAPSASVPADLAERLQLRN